MPFSLYGSGSIAEVESNRMDLDDLRNASLPGEGMRWLMESRVSIFSASALSS